MDSERLETALSALIHRLVHLATNDGELRTQLQQVAQAFLEITGHADEQSTPQPAVQEVSVVVPEIADEAIAPVVISESVVMRELPIPQDIAGPAPPQEPLPELTLGQTNTVAEPAPVTYPTRWARDMAPDLSLIEARCRLKAEGARWAGTRRRLLREGACFSTDIAPKDLEIIQRAKQIPDCYLWMCHPSGPSPSNVALFDDVAACFDAVADILLLLKQIQDAPDLHRAEFERTLDLLAEAQSALRIAVATLGGPIDVDQSQVFSWLKSTAAEKQILIQRYMRLDDPADVDALPDLMSRIEALDAHIQENQQRHKLRRKLLGKVRHKTSSITKDLTCANEQWPSLLTVVEELLSSGLPPSNTDLRELLVPVIDSLPDDLSVPVGFQLVLREMDRFQAAYPAPEPTTCVPPTEDVRQIAELLKGKSLVLIGGDRRGVAYQAIKDAFRLKELIWIETKEHQSISGFETHIARPDVAAVLLAIRWSSHSFAEVREFCERHGKPLVRLPGGYNPNQVAAQIISQCSERLKSQPH